MSEAKANLKSDTVVNYYVNKKGLNYLLTTFNEFSCLMNSSNAQPSPIPHSHCNSGIKLCGSWKDKWFPCHPPRKWFICQKERLKKERERLNCLWSVGISCKCSIKIKAGFDS